jgi:hypothetical protein
MEREDSVYTQTVTLSRNGGLRPSVVKAYDFKVSCHCHIGKKRTVPYKICGNVNNFLLYQISHAVRLHQSRLYRKKGSPGLAIVHSYWEAEQGT